MFNRILIANRGEIACRIMQTARKMGIETVAVYSTADQKSKHVLSADQAICIGQPAAQLSYLNREAIIAAALQSGAQAIHPGYGFLAENPLFAEDCAQAGLIFVGPSVAAMQAMASKQIAKQLLEKSSVPLTPGYHGSEQSDQRLWQEAQTIGFPILLKAAAGGGGKGMRTVHMEADFSLALASARREAKASFADDTMLIEKLIVNPRHVEVQIMADHHGNIVHLYERDCSMQRRHQKIIEEAPAPNLSTHLRQQITEAAITVARAIHYCGAGTVEFLVEDDQHFYFMEMNTRLQVEHPVTEMITNLDLVEWQLRIAANEPLPCKQEKIQAHGHALECRIYAEDPHNNFLPSVGKLRFMQEPEGKHVRIDSGVMPGTAITMYYDPMLAKLITWGETRAQALFTMQRALTHYHLGGVKTNIPFLQAILSHPKFCAAELSTDFLNQETLPLPSPNAHQALWMAACIDYLLAATLQKTILYQDTFAWQMHLKSQWLQHYVLHGKQHTLTIIPKTTNQLIIKLADEVIEIEANLTKNLLHINYGQQMQHITFENLPDQIILYLENGPLKVGRFDWQYQQVSASAYPEQLSAPMSATVVAILKNKGERLKAGENLLILEAMKMEHTLRAPRDGLLMDILFKVGDQVNEGTQLVVME